MDYGFEIMTSQRDDIFGDLDLDLIFKVTEGL